LFTVVALRPEFLACESENHRTFGFAFFQPQIELRNSYLQIRECLAQLNRRLKSEVSLEQAQAEATCNSPFLTQRAGSNSPISTSRHWQDLFATGPGARNFRAAICLCRSLQMLMVMVRWC